QGRAGVEKHIEFFRATGMDIVKIQYERPFPSQPISRPADWANIPLLDKAFFEPQLEVVRGLVEALKAEAPVVVTLYSPFMCAGHVGGRETLTAHLEEDPDAVRKGLEIVTESLRTFVQECIRIGVDGFYHSTQGAESRRFADPRIFTDTIMPFDLALMTEINRQCPFNILHICDYHRDEVGGYEDLSIFLDYPGHVVNASLHVGGRTLTPTEVSRLFGRPFMGGMDRMGLLAMGTEAQAREAARQALQEASGRFFLAADCTVPGSTPWENLRAAIDAAHQWTQT
ncbi:MAG TPA: uroporphyrinogen decarboxylase family protein, partial [Chthonomonadaceae bacterium]|nr:uroporphyrinogen decarboxylase family protein [Chthonomonadaceae bacterium]